MPVYESEDYIRTMRPIPKFVRRGAFGIPFIEKEESDIEDLGNGLWLTNINNVTSKAKHLERKINHMFRGDKELQRYYDHPYSFLEKVSKCYATASFDFSMHPGMSVAQIISATYKNRYSGMFTQTNGVRTFATVGWVEPDTYDICFEGLSDGAVFLISTLGVNNEDCEKRFLRGYREMRTRYPASRIISVGERIRGMDDDVFYVSYSESFGSGDRHSDYWQPRLFDARSIREER